MRGVSLLTSTIICALPAALLWAGGPPAADGEKHEIPPVFTTLTLAEAQAKAKGTDKLVVADFTAEWCGPCKMMDRTTWRDQKVVDWLKASAIAVQVDVDKSKDVARELHVSAMPTVMVFKGEEMVERRVGYMTGDQLLVLLNRAKNGEQKVDGMEAVVLPAPGDKPAANAEKARDNMTMDERLDAARALADNGKFEEATKEYLWLWKNIVKHEPAMIGVRGSFMAGDMGRLAGAYRPARKAFTDERDRLEIRLKTDERTFEDLDDWMVLNGVIGDEKATLAWFDRVKNDADVGPTFDRVGFRLKRLLEENERWADLGKLEADPLAAVRKSHQMWKGMPRMPRADEAMRKHMEQVHAQLFRNDAAVQYAAQLAAGKDAKAQAVLDLAVKLDPSGEMRVALVEKAIKAHQPRRSMIDELDKAEKAETDVKDVRKRLLKELGEAAG